MGNMQPFRVLGSDLARTAAVISVFALLTACGGKGQQQEVVAQAGKVERATTLAGRWNISYSMAENSCGYPKESTQTFADVVQVGDEVIFRNMQGVTLMDGELANARFESSAVADVSLVGRALHYTQNTRLQFRDNSMTGRESFVVEDSIARKECRGTLLWKGARSISRSTAAPSEHQGDQEPNDTLPLASSLPLNTVMEGVVEDVGNRVDIFAIPLESSGDYQVTLSGTAGNDLDLALLDRFNTVLALSENSPGLDEYLSFSVDAASGGNVYVVVSAFDTAGEPASYSLQVLAP